MQCNTQVQFNKCLYWLLYIYNTSIFLFLFLFLFLFIRPPSLLPGGSFAGSEILAVSIRTPFTHTHTPQNNTCFCFSSFIYTSIYIIWYENAYNIQQAYILIILSFPSLSLPFAFSFSLSLYFSHQRYRSNLLYGYIWELHESPGLPRPLASQDGLHPLRLLHLAIYCNATKEEGEKRCQQQGRFKH